MEKLEAFFKRLEPAKGHPMLWAWMGDVSHVRQGKTAGYICEQAGLACPQDALVSIDADIAAKVLAWVGSNSLAYGDRTYRQSLYLDAQAMFAELGPRPRFWSTHAYADVFDQPPQSNWGMAYTPITSFTFDAGIVAAGDTTGFIYWRAEED